jgi:hypothetical protein
MRSLSHPKEVLRDRDVVVRESAFSKAVPRIGEQHLWVARHRACEEYSQLRICLPKPLDDVLQQHATLPIPNLVRRVHDERADREVRVR